MTSYSFISTVFVVSVAVGFATSCKSNNRKVQPFDDEKAGEEMIRQTAINHITREMAAYPSVDGAAVGLAGTESQQYKRFRNLKQFATDKDLIALTDHESPNVRAYAFEALIDREYRYCKEILQRHVADTASFLQFSGCLGFTSYINLYYLRLLGHRLTLNEQLNYKEKISTSFGPDEWKLITARSSW